MSNPAGSTTERQITTGEAVSPADVERQVQAIAGSPQFANADALRSLLLFLSRRSAAPHEDPPKEMEIATAVLGRSDGFDSRVDSSVRVLVGRLRSKLAEYYVGTGAEDPIVLEVPRGSYSLVARPRVTAAVVVAPTAPVVESGGRRLWWPWVAAGCLGCVLVGFALGFAARSGAAAKVPDEQQRFWQGFLESPRPLLVVLGSPRFATIGKDWVVRSPAFLNNWPDRLPNPEVRKLEHLLNAPAQPVYSYIANGEALATLTLTQELWALRPKMRFRRSSQFQWDELRSQDVIFLGAPKLNPPTGDLPIEGDFICDLGEIRNLRPRPGERSEYGVTRVPADGPVTEAYVLVTRAAGREMFGETVVIGSPVSEGTWAAADFISTPSFLQTLLGRIARPDGGLPARFQVVLRFRMKADIPIEISYETHHELK